MRLDGEAHRRWNPLTRAWVLVSPGRATRPWQGQSEAAAAAEPAPAYEPHCYLCPGNGRAGGGRNPAYHGTFVFDNDYPALRPEATAGELECEGLIRAAAVRGRCRVVCFSPRHDLTLATLPREAVRAVVETWCEETSGLAAEGWRAVQIFENRGAAMGASNSHPHGQIWATEYIPDELAKELTAFGGGAALTSDAAPGGPHPTAGRCTVGTLGRGGGPAATAGNGGPLCPGPLQVAAECPLCRYLALERQRGERMVFEDEEFAAVVPFWAMWPFEVLLLPRRHVGSLPALRSPARDSLAGALHRLTALYDRVFATPFPYTMGFHQAPASAGDGWHLHAHYYPPLLRSATVRKFMVGFELLAEPQRDFTPEQAAERLRHADTDS